MLISKFLTAIKCIALSLSLSLHLSLSPFSLLKFPALNLTALLTKFLCPSFHSLQITRLASLASPSMLWPRLR